MKLCIKINTFTLNVMKYLYLYNLRTLGFIFRYTSNSSESSSIPSESSFASPLSRTAMDETAGQNAENSTNGNGKGAPGVDDLKRLQQQYDMEDEWGRMEEERQNLESTEMTVIGRL